MVERSTLRPIALAPVPQSRRGVLGPGPPTAAVPRADRLLGLADGEFRSRAILQLQASHGNAVVRSLIGRSAGLAATSPGLQRQPKPGPDPKPLPGPTPGPTPGTGTPGPTVTPAPASKPIAIGSVRQPKSIKFTSAKGDIGLTTVEVAGKVALSGTATFTATPPAKDVATWAGSEIESAVTAALSAAAPSQPTPATTPTTVTLSVGGQPLSVALSSTADLNRGFRVFARIRGPSGKAAPIYTFGGAQFTGSASIDAEVVFTPKKAAKAPADPSIGEEYLSSVSFAGTAGDKTYGKGRNVAVAGDDAVAALDKLPDKVKKDKALDTPEKKRNFLAFQRPWFGSDAATIAHFSKIELVDVPTKGIVFLHSDAKARLEAVQAEIGADAMPRNNGVAWSFRNLFDFSGAQNHANMHTLGLAIDYNAYANPMLEDSRLIDLIQTVTGRSHHLELGNYPTRRKLIKQMGDTTAGHRRGREEEARRLEGRHRLLHDARDPGRLAGQGLDDVQGQPRHERHEARRAEGKVRRRGQAQGQDREGERDRRRRQGAARHAEAVARCHRHPRNGREDPGDRPRRDRSRHARREGRPPGEAQGDDGRGEGDRCAEGQGRQGDEGAEALQDRAHASSSGSQPRSERRSTRPSPRPTCATDLDRLVKAAATAAGPVTADLALYAKKPAAGKASVGDLKSLWNSMQRLRAALNDPAFVFPESEGKAGWEVKDPSASQLLEMGYFNLATEKGKSEAFDLVFMKSMVKHGFELGAAWGTPDPMHFELIVKAPTAK